MNWAVSYDLLSADCHLGTGWAHNVLCIHVLISEYFRNVLFKTELGWHTVHVKDPDNSFMHIFPTAGAFEVWYKHTINYLFPPIFIFFEIVGIYMIHKGKIFCLLWKCVCFLFVCVCMCWICVGLNEGENVCVCVCACARAHTHVLLLL